MAFDVVHAAVDWTMTSAPRRGVRDEGRIVAETDLRHHVTWWWVRHGRISA